MRIEHLYDHPEWAAALGALHFEQWSALLPWWTLDAAIAELEDHARGGDYPTTLVAVDDDGTLLGSVSLLADDLPEYPQYCPWLASLLVLPPWRRRRVATALIAACERLATEQMFQELHLFTAGQQGLYERLGWHVVEAIDYHGHAGAIMARRLR